jgi:hypothetical protein
MFTPIRQVQQAYRPVPAPGPLRGTANHGLTKSWEALLYRAKNGSGYPLGSVDFGDLADIGQDGVLRRVMPNTPMNIVFLMIYK